MNPLLFGLLASSALVLGALVGARVTMPKPVLAGMLSFAAGALMAALAFELFQDSFEHGGIWRAVIGLIIGAVVFTGLSAWLDRLSAHPTKASRRKRRSGEKPGGKNEGAGSARGRSASLSGGAGLALLAAVTLDGVPENVALGVSIGGGTGGLALLAAIFASNFPESLVGSAAMREQGRSQLFIFGTWLSCAALLTGAVVLGAGPLGAASPETISFPLSFAAGAVLASLADTLMPEAYEQGGSLVALSTTAGFVLSFVLATQ